MRYQDLIAEAIQIVVERRYPDSALGRAIVEQARALAGHPAD